MGSFLGIATENAIEPQVIPPGEVQLKVISAAVATSKNGAPMLTAVFTFPGQVAAKLMTEYYMLPVSSDDPETMNRKTLALKHLQECLGLAEITDPSQLVGCEGRVILRVVPGNDKYPDEQNRINKYLKA